MNTDSLKTFVRSHTFASIIAIVGALAIVICIYEVGFLVGYHEATFSAGFGENYERNFGDAPMGMPDGHQPTPHGVEGEVLSIGSSTIIVANNRQPEEKVDIDSNTVIRNQENTVSLSSLASGDYVIVVGSPDSQGEIDAKLIRILPAPPQVPNASSSAPQSP